MTGNEEMAAKGKAQHMKGDAQEAKGKAKDAVDNVKDAAKSATGRPVAASRASSRASSVPTKIRRSAGSVLDWNIVLTGVVPFVLFLIAGTAELNRPPFDQLLLAGDEDDVLDRLLALELTVNWLEGVGGVSEMNQADGIHPNEDGAMMVAENVWQVLEPVLRPIRRIMPDTGAIDFSPLVLILILGVVVRVLLAM